MDQSQNEYGLCSWMPNRPPTHIECVLLFWHWLSMIFFVAFIESFNRYVTAKWIDFNFWWIWSVPTKINSIQLPSTAAVFTHFQRDKNEKFNTIHHSDRLDPLTAKQRRQQQQTKLKHTVTMIKENRPTDNKTIATKNIAWNA